MRLTAFTIVLASLTAPASAERSYDQPYLGIENENWKLFSGFRGWSKENPYGMAETLKAAEVVALGTAETLTAKTDKETGTTYTGNITLTELLKGNPGKTALTLKWDAWSTGIEDKPSEHLFLLKKDKAGEWEVISAHYLYPNKEYRKMRLCGAYGVDRELAMLAVRTILNEATEAKTLKADLLKSFQSKDWGEWYSAVEIACAVDFKYGAEVLRKAVSDEAAEKDLDRYARAVEALAAKGRSEEVKTILEGIPKKEGLSRLCESQAFSVIAKHGGEKSVRILREFAEKHPEYTVSAAFALAEIGGKEARETIQKWRENPEHTKTKVKISTGWAAEQRTTADLLKTAAAAFKEK